MGHLWSITLAGVHLKEYTYYYVNNVSVVSEVWCNYVSNYLYTWLLKSYQLSNTETALY
ncbi:MAG: hypothetical protein RLZZ422_1076 [Pseudomonadota bacterium]|jgi:hypothetical protein